MKTAYREIETVYTYNEWLKEYNRRASKQRAKQKEEHDICTIQRIFGILLLVGGVLAPVVLWDATISLVALPLGVFLILKKERIMVF